VDERGEGGGFNGPWGYVELRDASLRTREKVTGGKKVSCGGGNEHLVKLEKHLSHCTKNGVGLDTNYESRGLWGNVKGEKGWGSKHLRVRTKTSEKPKRLGGG